MFSAEGLKDSHSRIFTRLNHAGTSLSGIHRQVAGDSRLTHAEMTEEGELLKNQKRSPRFKKFCLFCLLVLTLALSNAIIAKSSTICNQLKPVADDKNTKKKSKTILFLGNSLTAGYGLQKSQAFPALLQQKIDSLGWNFEVVNAGLSGETSAGGLRRINWLLKRKVDILVLELGANDALRGLSLDLTKSNLQAIIDSTKNKYPRVTIIVAGMLAPPNLGEEYTDKFRSIFTVLSKDALLVPFLLEGVGGVPELNLPDGIHPTAEGHKIVAENVWKVLKPLLGSLKEN